MGRHAFYEIILPQNKKVNSIIHLRYAIWGLNVLVSLLGILEAPARKREFYIAQMFELNVNTNQLELNHPFVIKVLRNIFLQALVFYNGEYLFCENRY